MTSRMPSDGSARTSSPMSSASARPSSPVPAPTSIVRVVDVSGTFARIASATVSARSRRSGVSHSRARSSNVAMLPPFVA